MKASKVAVGSRVGQAGLFRINEGEIRCHLDEVVRGPVEETLNGLHSLEP